MYEMGSSAYASSLCKPSERQRSDIAFAVTLAVPDGAEFERILGAENAPPSSAQAEQRPARDVADNRQPAQDQRSTRTESHAHSSRGRSGRDTPADQNAKTSGRPTALADNMPRLVPVSEAGAEYRATTAAGNAVACADDPDLAGYAKLLNDLMTTRSKASDGTTVRAVESGETAKDSTQLLQAERDAGQNSNFDPSVQLLKVLAQGTDPLVMTKAASVPQPPPETSPQMEQQIRAQVVGQLTGRLGGLGGKGSLKLTLTPPELGRVEIRFTRTGDKLQLHFRVESASAARALQNGAGHLQELLLSRNGHWQQIDVTVERKENEDNEQARQRENDPDDTADRESDDRDVQDEQRGEE